MAGSLKLLRFLNESLQDMNCPEVILRSHPFTPIEALTKKYDIKLPPNFKISKNRNFEEELKETSMLIYTDTTSSMEAVMCGIPVVCVDFKEPANSDPLFKISSFKWAVSNKEELLKAIDDIYSMNNDDYLKRYKEAMDYLKRYFYPVEGMYLKKFIT